LFAKTSCIAAAYKSYRGQVITVPLATWTKEIVKARPWMIFEIIGYLQYVVADSGGRICDGVLEEMTDALVTESG
jgi:hypothetical protein